MSHLESEKAAAPVITIGNDIELAEAREMLGQLTRAKIETAQYSMRLAVESAIDKYENGKGNDSGSRPVQP